MSDLAKSVSEKSYNPNYFLSSLGNGGLAISFYMYLHFLVPHVKEFGGYDKVPLISFEALMRDFKGDDIFRKFLLVVMIGMFLYLSARHFKYLFFNLKQYENFKKGESFKNLLGKNGEISLMAIPLTFAMTINIFFVAGSLFVPGLWSFVEYLFPGAIMGFGLAGFFALKMFFSYFQNMLVTGKFDCSKNNNLSQMIAIFTFTMVAVGLSAAAAMSNIKATATIGMIGSIFFLTISVIMGFVQFVIGMRSMLTNGIDEESSVSLWVVVPIVTLFGIAVLRLVHGIEYYYETHYSHGFYFGITWILVSIQIFFLILGYGVLKKINYFKNYIFGDKASASSYALICPGVAMFVFGLFFIQYGLVESTVLTKFSPLYFLVLTPFVAVQLVTFYIFLKLDKKHYWNKL